MNALSKNIIWLLENRPEEWHSSEYTLRNSKAGIVMWIGNGYALFKCETPNSPLGLFGSLAVWRACKTWAADSVLRHVSEKGDSQ